MMRSERHNKPMKWRDFAAQSKHYIIVKIMDNCSRLCVILSQFGSNIKTNVVVKGLYFPVWNYCLFGCSSLWKHDSSFRQFEGIVTRLHLFLFIFTLQWQYKLCWLWMYLFVALFLLSHKDKWQIRIWSRIRIWVNDGIALKELATVSGSEITESSFLFL